MYIICMYSICMYIICMYNVCMYIVCMYIVCTFTNRNTLNSDSAKELPIDDIVEAHCYAVDK